MQKFLKTIIFRQNFYLEDQDKIPLGLFIFQVGIRESDDPRVDSVRVKSKEECLKFCLAEREKEPATTGCS